MQRIGASACGCAFTHAQQPGGLSKPALIGSVHGLCPAAYKSVDHQQPLPQAHPHKLTYVGHMLLVSIMAIATSSACISGPTLAAAQASASAALFATSLCP